MNRILAVVGSESEINDIKNALDGYCVLAAGNGAEAVHILERHEVCVVILDLNIPEMEGAHLLRTLMEGDRFGKLRVIILSDRDEPQKEVSCLKLGAVDCIHRPICMDLLKARVDVHAVLLCAQRALVQQLDEKSHSLDLIFEQAPIGIAVSQGCDSDPSADVIVKVNSTFEQITGMTREELMSSGWPKITHPDDLEEDMENFRKLRAGEIRMYSMDKRYIRPDGSIVWVHMVVAPLDLPNERQYKHICLVQDITARKEMEKALDESERSKSVLLANLPGLAYRCFNDEEWTMQ